MPNKDNITGFEGAALLTVNLIDHSRTPNSVADAILETLIEMSAETKIGIWHESTGLSVEALSALYSLSETGLGYRRVRLYGAYEATRTRRFLKPKE